MSWQYTANGVMQISANNYSHAVLHAANYSTYHYQSPGEGPAYVLFVYTGEVPPQGHVFHSFSRGKGHSFFSAQPDWQGLYF